MLASMLMESAFGAPDVSPEVLSRYNHEDGAALIAMESAADLHDIFVEGFIGMEELEFQQYRANMEGASEDVMEGIGDKIASSAKNAIMKIKELIKKLWEKVKAFFHNVRRFLDGIFMNGTDFVKKYEGELKKLKLDSGCTYKMYKYTITEYSKKMVTSNKQSVNAQLKYWNGLDSWLGKEEIDTDTGLQENDTKFTDDSIAELKKDFGITDIDDMSKARETVWSKLRGGATSEADKEDVVVKISEIISTLKSAPAQTKMFTDIAKDNDRLYSEIIKKLNTVADLAEKQKGGKRMANAARKYASKTSQVQNIKNMITNETKNAMSECVKAYKGACMAALKYKPKTNR